MKEACRNIASRDPVGDSFREGAEFSDESDDSFLESSLAIGTWWDD
jgi:hypothetical protein